MTDFSILAYFTRNRLFPTRPWEGRTSWPLLFPHLEDASSFFDYPVMNVMSQQVKRGRGGSPVGEVSKRWFLTSFAYLFEFHIFVSNQQKLISHIVLICIRRKKKAKHRIWNTFNQWWIQGVARWGHPPALEQWIRLSRWFEILCFRWPKKYNFPPRTT